MRCDKRKTARNSLKLLIALWAALTGYLFFTLGNGIQQSHLSQQNCSEYGSALPLERVYTPVLLRGIRRLTQNISYHCLGRHSNGQQESFYIS